MTVIKINAITVPAGSGDELAHRFAARAGAVDGADGFEGFELLRPTDDREQWLVITRWRDEESFQSWVSSPGFAEGHRSAVERAGGEAPRPVSTHSEVWNYEVAGGSTAQPEHVHDHTSFDDEAATWDDDPGHEERQVAVAEAIQKAVNLSPRMSALDVGGGTGRLSILLSDRVGSVVVTDPSAGMVQVARQRIADAGLDGRLRAVRADLTTDALEGAYDVAWSSMALHHVRDLDSLLRSVAGLLVDGGRLAIADLDEDPDGAFHAQKVDFDGHDGFDRQRLTEQLTHAGFADVTFVDATTIPKGDREFGVFLCTATKGS